MQNKLCSDKVISNELIHQILCYAIIKVSKDDVVIVELNEQAEHLFELKQKDLAGKGVAGMGYTNKAIATFRERLPEKGVALSSFWAGVLLRADLSKVEVELSGFWLEENEPGWQYYFIQIKDVSAYRYAVRAMKKSEQRYRELVEDANAIILTLTPEGQVTLFNEYAQRFFGFSEEEIIGQHVVGTIVPEEESTGRNLRPLMDDILHHPENYANNINENMKKDGTRVWISWANRVLRDNQGKPIGVTSIGTDITEQRHAEEELRQTYKMNAVGLLAGGIAHDFNNMLSVIGGYMQLLSLATREKKSLGYLVKVQIAVDRASDLTKKLLAYARKANYQKEIIDVHEHLTGVMELAGVSFSKKITIEQCFNASECFVEADPGQLENAFMNLVFNARDAMPNGGSLKVQTRNFTVDTNQQQLSELAQGDYLLVSIKDEGEGIADEHADQVFEPFFTTKPLGKGTGMGLAATYGTVKAHNGHVEFSSTLLGTDFLVFLPLSQSQPTQTMQEPAVQYMQGSGHILVVDDEPLIRQLCRELLEKHGYRVTIKDCGWRALDYFENNNAEVDLVILDMVMPDMDGAEVYEVLKKLNPEVKVVIATGYGTDEALQDLRLEGVSGIVQKPYNEEMLKLAYELTSKRTESV